MTYSIVAVDLAASLVGVAAQSHHLAVGARLAFADPHLGAVAVQSYAEREYGPAVLDGLRTGRTPIGALAHAVGLDRRASRAQVAVVSADGEAAAHTGSRCVPAAGHVTGIGVSVQANMAATPDVWQACLDAFTSANGRLATRLLAGLDAAEAAGGDLRGRQSAVLLVAGTDGTRIDVRVDDGPEPLAELRRLVTLQYAATEMSRAFEVARAGGVAEAVAMLVAAQADYGPDNLEPTVWAAVLLARSGDTATAGELMARAMARHHGWAEFIRRLARADLVPDDPAILAEITGTPP